MLWPAQVVVLGKSLGGAVALHVAATNPDRVAAVIVENTFLSIEDVAPKVSPGPGARHQVCVVGQGVEARGVGCAAFYCLGLTGDTVIVQVCRILGYRRSKSGAA